MSDLLEQAMSADNLNAVWQRLRSQHTPWRIDVDRNQLSRDLLKYVLTCREQVLKGKYRSQAVRQFAVPKAKGGQRVLSAQFLQDKFVQRAVLNVIEPLGEAKFHHDSFAYRPGRNVEKAVNRVRERTAIGYNWLVDADITACFDNIRHWRLQSCFDQLVNDPKISGLLAGWLSENPTTVSFWRGKRGIPQGAIWSPFLCNVYLHQLDQTLARKHISFVRYADDFVVFAKTKQDAKKYYRTVADTLDSIGLTLHPQKTRILKAKQVKFLGKSCVAKR